MDLNKLRIFAIAAETGNLSQTARLTGYTQSGVSHMLKSLETEVRLPLLTRTRYGVSLTSAGADFLREIQGLLAESRKVEQYLREVQELEEGVLRIATFSSISIHWLPQIISRFQAAYPGVHVRLRVGGTQDIEQWLTGGEVELGLYSRQPGQPFTFLHIRDDPMVAVLPEDYPLPEGCDSFPLNQFQDRPFILSEIGVDYDVNRILREAGVQPDVQVQARDDYAIMAMVERGLGLSILPQLIAQEYAGRLKILPLSPAHVRDLGIGLTQKESVSPAARQFLRFISEYFSL